MSWESRAIDLDDIHADDPSFVVTGVRFRVLGAHLNLEAKLTEIDYAKGELKSIEFWKSNDNTDVSGLKRYISLCLNNAHLLDVFSIRSQRKD